MLGLRFFLFFLDLSFLDLSSSATTGAALKGRSLLRSSPYLQLPAWTNLHTCFLPEAGEFDRDDDLPVRSVKSVL